MSATRIQSSVTSLSWIPSEAVTGLNKAIFGTGFTHYDDPPPDRIDDLEALRAGDAFRFANHLAAWIDVVDGADRRRRLRGRLRDGLDDRRRSAGKQATFAGVSFDDIQRPVAIDGDVGDVRAVRGRAHRAAGAAPGEQAAVRQVRGADGVDDAVAHDQRRRIELVRAARRESVPATLGLRRRRRAGGEGRPRRLQGVVAELVRQAHAVGSTPTRRRS